MSQSTLQRAPGTLQDVPKRRRVSGRAFANGLQEIRDVSGKALQQTQMPKCLHIARRSSVPERPRSLQECLRAPSSGQAPFTMSQSVLECLTWRLPMASKISGTCLGRLYNGPDARMSAHGSPVACFSLLHASGSPCQNHSDHEHRQWRDPGHLKPSHPERNHNPNHKQGQGGICAILLMTCNLRPSWH